MIACAPPAEEAIVDEAAAEQAALGAFTKADEELNQQWDAAATAGDYENIASFFTENGIWMPTDLPASVGRDAIRSAMQSDFEENVRIDSKNVTEEIRLAGELALVRGTFEETIAPKAGGEPVQSSGKWLEIREQQPDGSWKIARSIWNRAAPLPSGE